MAGVPLVGVCHPGAGPPGQVAPDPRAAPRRRPAAGLGTMVPAGARLVRLDDRADRLARPRRDDDRPSPAWWLARPGRGVRRRPGQGAARSVSRSPSDPASRGRLGEHGVAAGPSRTAASAVRRAGSATAGVCGRSWQRADHGAARFRRPGRCAGPLVVRADGGGAVEPVERPATCAASRVPAADPVQRSGRVPVAATASARTAGGAAHRGGGRRRDPYAPGACRQGAGAAEEGNRRVAGAPR